MEGKKIAGAILGTMIRITAAIVVIYFIYNVAIESYNFGYRVFADVPMEISPGRDKDITIVQGKSSMEIGEILEQAGLIKDAKIFYVQELLSEYHGEIVPGIYTLNTSMTSEEMMTVMSGQGEDEEEAESEE